MSIDLLALLSVGFIFGLKHALEVDHVVAISSIVSEQRSLWRSSLVGGMWGLGHTASLIAIGFVVLVLRVAIPKSLANWFEFAVALMIIGLGASALFKLMRHRKSVHRHQHTHDGQAHIHIHFHDAETEHDSHGQVPVKSHSHKVSRVGLKPFVVGAVHGLAGSAALLLLVLVQFDSVWLGLAYLGLFGIGSTGGMLLMSSLIGLPFVLTGRRITGLNFGLQAAAGGLSIVFGLWYAYGSGVTGLLW